MTKNTGKTTTNEKTGIYFCGIVEERRKRMVPKENPETEVVTYTFYDENSRTGYYVDDYAPESYYEVGEYIEVPVRVKAYVHRGTNRPAYSLTVKKAISNRETSNNNGELF